MTRCISKRKSGRWLVDPVVGVAMAMFGCFSDAAYADEGGVSYWLPGRFSSLAATPQVPGWSMAEVYYHTTVSASGAVAAARPPVSPGDTQVERRRSQFHDLSDGRHSRWRLRSNPPRQSRHRPRRYRWRRR